MNAVGHFFLSEETRGIHERQTVVWSTKTVVLSTKTVVLSRKTVVLSTKTVVLSSRPQAPVPFVVCVQPVLFLVLVGRIPLEVRR